MLLSLAGLIRSASTSPIFPSLVSSSPSLKRLQTSFFHILSPFPTAIRGIACIAAEKSIVVHLSRYQTNCEGRVFADSLHPCINLLKYQKFIIPSCLNKLVVSQCLLEGQNPLSLSISPCVFMSLAVPASSTSFLPSLCVAGSLPLETHILNSTDSYHLLAE